MREWYRDIMVGLAVVVGAIQAYFAARGPLPSDPPAIRMAASHPIGGLVVFAALFLIAGILNSMPLLLRFFPTKQSKELSATTVKPSEIAPSKSNDPVGWASSLLDNQVHEIARIRINELADRANYLRGRAPLDTEASRAFCEFWVEEANDWGVVVQNILATWGKRESDAFTNLDGYNRFEAIGKINDAVADAYRLLLHRQRNLQNLRLSL
jgi:hypothetical protein